MEVFLNYFIPAISLLLVLTLPLYLIRIYMYFKRTHYMLQSISFRISMYVHGFILVAFAVTLLFIRNVDPKVETYIFVILAFVSVCLAIGYRAQFAHQRSHRYAVYYSKWDNRKAWQKYLLDQHLGNVDVDEGSFSFVSNVSFARMDQTAIDECLKDFEEQDFLHPLNTKTAYYLLAFQVFMLSLTLVAFILFFVYLPLL